jgi:hypothetical protein
LIKQPMLQKVFLALKTNFIPELETEHITLAYYPEIRFDALLDLAAKYDNMLPATIHLHGKMNWVGYDDRQYWGYEVAASDSAILSHLKMPHITVPFHLLEQIKTIDLEPIQIMDTLHLGKRVGDKLIWAKINGNQIGLDNDNPASFL